MKVLIVNSYRSKGGASRAAVRLFEALSSININSEFLYVYDDSLGFFEKVKYYVRVAIDRIPGVFAAKKKVMFSLGAPSNKKLIDKINSSSANIVHLHWMNAGAISIKDIPLINKPVIWSLHDMWPFTGGCHYSYGCMQYKEGCGACPVISSSIKNDLSRYGYKRKYSAYQINENIFFVGLSRWIYSKMVGSGMVPEGRVYHLPNTIDCNLFFPKPMSAAREAFRLPKDKYIVLFGAVSAVDDPRKGYSLLSEALKILSRRVEICAVIFGSEETGPVSDRYQTVLAGKVSDDHDLSSLYSAADVMVVPSIEENLSNVIMESLSCSTPVVCYDIGGNSDMVEHKVNGYLASDITASSLASGIYWVLTNSKERKLRRQARNTALCKFDYPIVAGRYKDFYSLIMESYH